MAKTEILKVNGMEQLRYKKAPKPIKAQVGPPTCRCAICKETILKSKTAAIAPGENGMEIRACKSHEGMADAAPVYAALKAKFPVNFKYYQDMCWVCGIDNDNLFIMEAPVDVDFRTRKVKMPFQAVVNQCDKVRMCLGCVRNMNMTEAFNAKFPGNSQLVK